MANTLFDVSISNVIAKLESNVHIIIRFYLLLISEEIKVI